MQLYRIGPDFAVPISHHGSRFRIGGVAETRGDVRVSVIHVPPGGLIGWHPAVGRQLLCVVGGDGFVTGGDGVRRRVRTFDAALFEEGEEHETESEGGLTAICIEGDFEVSARSVLREIVVLDYDPEWAQWFEEVRKHVWPVVGPLAIRLDHVGSTAVPGLAAKPIIDADIVVEQPEVFREVIDAIGTIGYRWLGELGVPGREAFKYEGQELLPAHHLYVVVDQSRAHLDHVLLRDLLREDAEARRRYGELKRANVELAAGDIDAYGAAKSGLIAELLTRARAEQGLPPVEYWQPEQPA
ncbi:MAG TPA: GrpB family protein [Acidimicrobiales bacterium]|nr:GrpB family protein [Acidimicrobiales bacterium]